MPWRAAISWMGTRRLLRCTARSSTALIAYSPRAEILIVAGAVSPGRTVGRLGTKDPGSVYPSPGRTVGGLGKKDPGSVHPGPARTVGGLGKKDPGSVYHSPRPTGGGLGAIEAG